jgi:hypothetical protein
MTITATIRCRGTQAAFAFYTSVLDFERVMAMTLWTILVSVFLRAKGRRSSSQATAATARSRRQSADLQATRERIVPLLESQGYDYFWRPTHGDDGPPFYAWFIKRNPASGARTQDVQMVELNFGGALGTV